MKKVFKIVSGLIGGIGTIFGIVSLFIDFRNPRLSISLLNEIPVIDTYPADCFLGQSESKCEPVENILFSLELYKVKVSVLSFEIKNKGRETANLEDQNRLMMIFEDSCVLGRPILKSSKSQNYLDKVIVTDSDTVTLPLSVINPGETYTLDIMLFSGVYKEKDIKVSGKVNNQKKIRLHNLKDAEYYLTY